MEIVILAAMAIVSGVLGRMGGAQGYNTKYRDVGCSVVLVGAVVLLLGFDKAMWWVYLLIFGLNWASLTTYWDELFGGVDNLWFSGLISGIALLPIIYIDRNLLWFVIGRAVFLCVAWGCLNKYLPQKGIWIWRRDVAEEFTRYAVAL